MKEKEDKITEAKKVSGVHGCVECGRCVAACPMAEMYTNFSIEMSPRGIIKKILMGEPAVEDIHIWYCTECNAGADVCPQGVSCRDLIRALRETAIDEGVIENAKTCTSCGRVFVAVPVENFVYGRLQEEPANLFNTLDICPPCRREMYLVRNA
ncbi:MAG: 4Fe-4S dicluster domain-containing protein [Deltaproteobacteria bacterium]|nr:4Fe-4S dicluster domain-containing protein [Deltaproteobacteria bacterium]